MLKIARTGLLALLVGAQEALAQATSPAPPVPESKPATAHPPAGEVDLNWLWLALVLALVVVAIYVAMQRRRPPGRT
ncbi:hypothetical protein [Methylobacterium oxalidis]|uniref:Uncharacterized protein n=1 Tax=Methylobacterium oxalidis TaxID=944322 RepID=A0A512J9F0_9HYPH|nr:hypothetical protein [Methylobacterium oxalidis]GEP06535.1 hypothetical protein MOX02_45730 [Methylobacterium oxalidis]GJE30732.1 hypothetical protein LDDCCGHA_0901 [Methylobacterium oxalidis]GLS63887.1 hypothetical protein GCM10007888_22680 [Methylobacterium oxalidis]